MRVLFTNTGPWGTGSATLEAMGCGTPVVVTRTGGPDKFAVGEVVEKENLEQSGSLRSFGAG